METLGKQFLENGARGGGHVGNGNENENTCSRHIS